MAKVNSKDFQQIKQKLHQCRSSKVCHMTSHLTTLVNRFLRTLENVKSWNRLDSLEGEAELRRHVSNILEYTFYFHRKQVTEQEVDDLIRLLEKGVS